MYLMRGMVKISFDCLQQRYDVSFKMLRCHDYIYTHTQYECYFFYYIVISLTQDDMALKKYRKFDTILR